MSDYDVIVIGSGAAGNARAASGPLGQEDPDPRARRLAATRAAETGPPGTCSSITATSRRHLVRRRRQALPATGPLLRWWREQSSTARRCIECAKRTSASSSTTAGSLRPGRSPTRDGALLHKGRAALRGARRARRGPDRTARQRALSVPRGLARAADSAALRRRTSRRRPAPVPRALRVMLNEANMPYSNCVRCSTCDGFPAWCTPSPTLRCSASGRPSSTRTSRC